MRAVVNSTAMSGARIVAMPLGSVSWKEWEPFREAAGRHPNILFVVPAGNNGWNLDERPVYPAAFDLDNMIVVTSSSISGKQAPGSNWGPDAVNLMVPAERAQVIDHRGATGRASGSSYAVPKIAALAARLLAKSPQWGVPSLKRAIKQMAGPTFERGAKKVCRGWIQNPVDSD